MRRMRACSSRRHFRLAVSWECRTQTPTVRRPTAIAGSPLRGPQRLASAAFTAPARVEQLGDLHVALAMGSSADCVESERDLFTAPFEQLRIGIGPQRSAPGAA